MSHRPRQPPPTERGSWYVAEPRGDTFAALLKFALGRVDVLLAVTHADAPLSAKCSRVLAELRSAATTSRSRRGSSWPGTPAGPRSDVHEFRYGPAIVKVVLANSSSLFAWRLPDLPEDFCLVCRDTPWLITTTHEGDCRIETEQGEFTELLRTVPSLSVITGPGFRGATRRR